MTPIRGAFDGAEHRFPVHVYFEDTDLSGIVYHANYLRFFERARSDMLARLDIDQRGAIEAGTGAYAVTQMEIKWKSPAKLGDDLLVVSTVKNVRAASCFIQQAVMRSGEILCQATVTVALLSPDGRPVRQPADWTEKFKAVLAEGEE